MQSVSPFFRRTRDIRQGCRLGHPRAKKFDLETGSAIHDI